MAVTACQFFFAFGPTLLKMSMGITYGLVKGNKPSFRYLRLRRNAMIRKRCPRTFKSVSRKLKKQTKYMFRTILIILNNQLFSPNYSIRMWNNYCYLLIKNRPSETISNCLYFHFNFLYNE